MSATIVRTAGDEASQSDAPGTQSETERSNDDGWIDLAATLGLFVYSLAIAYGFSRVYTDTAFFADFALIAAALHGVPFLGRRLRVPVAIVVVVTLAATAWLVAWCYFPDTLAGGLPLTDTWTAMGEDFRLARADFRTVSAPVEYAVTWGFLGAVAFTITTWLSDTFAFRANARGESLVPGAVLFVFIAALGVDERRVLCSLAVVGAGFTALALLRLRAERRPRTVLGRELHPLLLAAPGIAVVAALVIGGSWALGPALPGAGEPPLFDTKGTAGATDVISPMVDIRARLVNDAEAELFSVTATEPSYWRLSALPRFDGERWDLPDGELDELVEHGAVRLSGTRSNQQLLTIAGLRGPLVPAAPEPISASGPGVGYNELTGTLVRSNGNLASGDVFEIVSAMPRFDANTLRGASVSSPPSPVFLELPDDLPSVVAATAAEVTAGGTTPFERAVLLQDWFRANFTYSVEVPEGHSNSAIVDFLDQRIGYCEQFAGTYAAMARTLGIPSRVAVGFTQGEPSEGGRYVVRGRNAHAWPEIWLDGYGWIPFEPTPGRGLPGAEVYTGVTPQQDEGPATTTTSTTTTTTPDGAAQPPPQNTAAPTTLPPNATPPPDDGTRNPQGDDAAFPWLILLAITVVLGTLLAAPALIRRWRRGDGDHGDPAQAASALWDRSLRALDATGFRSTSTATTHEVAEAAGEYLPEVAEPMAGLAEVASMATYAPTELVAAELRADDGDGPYEWTDWIEDTVNDTLTLPQRLRRYFTVLR